MVPDATANSAAVAAPMNRTAAPAAPIYQAQQAMPWQRPMQDSTQAPMQAFTPYQPPEAAAFQPQAMPFGGYRKDGGRISPRRRYIVGEDGPEEIVLDQPGTVIPTDKTTIQPRPEAKSTARYAGEPQPPEEAVETPAISNNPYTPNPTVGMRPASAQPVSSTPLLARIPASMGNEPPKSAEAMPIENNQDPQPVTAGRPGAEANEVAGDIPPLLPATLSPRDRYDQKQKKLADLDKTTNPVKKTSRGKSALQAGLLSLSKAFGRPIRDENDFLAALAQTGVYMAGGAIDPTLGPDMRRDADIAKARGEADQATDAYGADEKLRKGEADINNAELQPHFKEMAASLAQTKLQNQVLNEERNAELKRQKMQHDDELAGNKTKLDWDEESGQMMRYFLNDPTRAPEPVMLDEGKPWIKSSKKQYEIEDPLTGRKITVNGGQILNYSGQVQATNTKIGNDADKYNSKEWDDYQQKMTAYDNNRNGLMAKGTASLNLAGDTQKDLDQLTLSIQQQGYPATAQQQTSMSTMRQKIRELHSQSESFKNEYDMAKPPSQPTTFTPKKVPTAGKYAGRVFPSPAALHKFFPGKSDAEIKLKIEQNGGSFGQ